MDHFVRMWLTNKIDSNFITKLLYHECTRGNLGLEWTVLVKRPQKLRTSLFRFSLVNGHDPRMHLFFGNLFPRQNVIKPSPQIRLARIRVYPMMYSMWIICTRVMNYEWTIGSTFPKGFEVDFLKSLLSLMGLAPKLGNSFLSPTQPSR